MVLVIVSVTFVAAFCATEKMEAKNPPVPPGDDGCPIVPPGVFTSSGKGVSGAVVDCESLLEMAGIDRTRLCEAVLVVEGTESLVLGRELGSASTLELDQSVEEASLASVGVGGVTRVVGASTRFGGVAGTCGMIL